MRTGRVLGLVAVGMALTISTATRVQVFSHERLIWQDAVAKAPDKPRPWINLGRQYALDGASVSAREAYETAIDLASAPGRTVEERIVGLAVAEANLGVLLRDAGDPRARLFLTAAAARLPSDPAVARVTSWTHDITAR